jgi:hypothetical protein
MELVLIIIILAHTLAVDATRSGLLNPDVSVPCHACGSRHWEEICISSWVPVCTLHRYVILVRTSIPGRYLPRYLDSLPYLLSQGGRGHLGVRT